MGIRKRANAAGAALRSPPKGWRWAIGIGVANLLESRHRDEVAAKADVSGPVGNPRISNWQAIGRLIQNAFFKTILPGFEKEASRPRRR